MLNDEGQPRCTFISNLRIQLTSGMFSRGAFSYIIAFGGVGVSSFAFHIIVAKILHPSHYGVMGALLSIISLLSVPLSAVQIAVTQAVIDKENQGQSFSILQVTLRSLGGGLLAMLALAMCAPLIDNFLHINSPSPIFLVAAWIPLATVSSVLQGALVGEFRFRPVAFATFAGIGVVRLVLGAIMVEAGLGVSGAVSAMIFAQAFTMLSLLFSARHELFGHRDAPVVRTKMRDTTLSVAALSGYTALTGIDTFLARHFFAPTLAGQYAAVAVVAHITFVIPAAIVTVTFPHLVEGKGISESSRRIFRQSLQFSLILGVASAIVMTLYPKLVIAMIFGSGYSGASGVLGVLAFASAAVGVTILYVYLHLARRSIIALTPWIGVVLSILAVYLDHGSAIAIGVVMFVVSLATMALAIIPIVTGHIRNQAN